MRYVLYAISLISFNCLSMNDSLEKSDNSKLYKDLKTFINNHQPLSNDDQGIIKTEIWALKTGKKLKRDYDLSELSLSGNQVLKYIVSQAKILAVPHAIYFSQEAKDYIEEAQKLFHYVKPAPEVEFNRKIMTISDYDYSIHEKK